MKLGSATMGLLFTLMVIGTATAGESQNEGATVETEKVVVTATMTEKIIQDAPGAVEVISAQEIMDMNAQTVAEAVAEATSLVVTTETGRQERPSIRGTNNNHTLVLIDGRRLAAGFKDMLGLEQIPVDMIERIEVVRGPASSLYGSDAIGGVVNIITRKPPKAFAIGATGQYGQSTYKEAEQGLGSAHIGHSWGPLGVLLAGGYQEKNGYDRDGAAPDDGDAIKLKSAGGRFSFDVNTAHRLLAGFEAVERSSVGLRDMEQLDRERDAEDRRINYFLGYEGKPTAMTSVMLRGNHSEHESDIDIDPPTAGIAGAIGDESNAERALDQLEGRLSSMLFQRHLVTFGVDYRRETREDDTGMDDDFNVLSFYAQDEYQVFDPLSLVLGLRWDDHSEFGSQWTPRASMIYSLFPNLRVKASYGQGFRAPGFMELYVPTYMRRGKEVYEPNADLDAETSESYEVGIEGEYNIVQGRLTAFRNSIEDMIEAIYDRSTGAGPNRVDYYQYQNIAEATLEGVEFEWRVKLPLGFDLSGNLAYLETEDKSTGEELEGRPDYKGSVKLGYYHPALGLRANVRLNYLGDRYYTAGSEDEVTLFSAYLSKEVAKGVTLFTGADNIFNSGDDNGVEPAFYYAGMSLSY